MRKNQSSEKKGENSCLFKSVSLICYSWELKRSKMWSICFTLLSFDTGKYSRKRKKPKLWEKCQNCLSEHGRYLESCHTELRSNVSNIGRWSLSIPKKGQHCLRNGLLQFYVLWFKSNKHRKLQSQLGMLSVMYSNWTCSLCGPLCWRHRIQ